MSGKLTVNKITNCSDLTIKMDKATIVGNYSSLEINDISNSSGTTISMTDMKVMTFDQYNRSKLGDGARRDGYPRGVSQPPGSLVVNKVRDCHATNINQDGMSIEGNFDDVKLNDISRSSKTDISMNRIKVDIEDSSSDEDQSPTPACHATDDPNQEEELPKPSTYEYYKAPKFQFSIKLGGGANVTCTFLQRDRVKSIKKFIRELQPRFGDKEFRLQIVGVEPPTFVDNDPELTLERANFRDNLELRTVMTSPTSDNY
ncbi:uncharacterized protein LOC120335673 isoform X2 [Styela clava]|uniref:uncharacterized protein LOC120335673 isoform X2 n=1 Tax=Styela clava TaxID=7725 RepID=UPI00193AB010|nr:uncharacterized protein LOC120335673 isoform X2 [Styela clava]